MENLPRCPSCRDADWSIPGQLSEPCFIRFDEDGATEDFADPPVPLVYLRHTDATIQSIGPAFCTSCGWTPTPSDNRSLHVNEPLLRDRLVGEALDYEGTWPTAEDRPGSLWPITYHPDGP
jgi:hypothetical protein